MAAENDPYNTMLDSEKNDIRPGFLGGNGDGEGKGKAAGALAAAENIAGAVIAAKGGGAGKAASGATGASKASGAKNALSDGIKSGAQKAEANEKNPGGLYNRNAGKQETEDDKSSKKKSKGARMALAAAAPLLILLLAIGGIIALIVGLPIMMIGALDYNLMSVLGFDETVGILEEQGEHVTAEFAKNGKMPSGYFEDLVANGIDVGQITANGDFVRTDTYIANIENRNDLVASASGFSYISEDEGELAMLWDGKIIYADDFVAAVESDPNLYAAYSKAADISTKYYYSDDVENVYKDMGLSRGNFNDFEVTGDYEKDHEKYVEILNKTLDYGSDVGLGGYYGDKRLAKNPDGADESIIAKILDALFGDDGGDFYEQGVADNDAGGTIGSVSEDTREYIKKWKVEDRIIAGVKAKYPVPDYSNNATKRASELLNTAVSSNEPYLASNAFISIEEPIQRARVDGGGPINHVMNTLTQGTEVSYQNVETGGIETSDKSILETKNFRAAVSDSRFDAAEASNFGRDRVLKTTGQADHDIIKKTTVATDGKSAADSVVRNGKSSTTADADIVGKATENIELAQSKSNSESFQSVVGGNRIIEGGSFLSNTINMHVIGAMPSDEDTIAAYDKEVEKTMARRAEADRASKSPFDITSPHTFLGSIVHNIATSVLGSYGSGGTNTLSVLNSVGATTSKAIANLTTSATANSNEDKFTTMSGVGCETVESAGGLKGDLYCTSHNTVSTNHMSKTQADWESIINEDKWEDFYYQGMSRYATVGVKNAEVCEKYREKHDSAWTSVLNFFKNITGTYEVCEIETDADDNIVQTPENLEKLAIFTGARYSFGSEGDKENELYSGYALYKEVRSLLSGEESAVSILRREYEETHPRDNSTASLISRRSGMTKGEAEIALAYADYLNEIAAYDPSTRMMGAPVISFEKPILEYYSDSIALELYAWYSKQTEYDDLRTRNFVV